MEAEIRDPPYEAVPEHHAGDLLDFAVDYNVSQFARYDDDLTYDYSSFMEPLYYSQTYKIVGACVGVAILVVGLTMNTLLIHMVKKCPSMFVQTPATSQCRLFMYLAVADNLVLLTSCLLHVIELFLIFNQWVFGKAGCAVLVFLQYFSNDIVGLATLLLAVERYCTYSQNPSLKFVQNRTGFLIFVSCLLAMLFSSPFMVLSRTYILEYHDVEVVYVEECSFNISMVSMSIYYLCDTIVFYFVPLFGAVVLYMMMFTPVDRMQVAMDRQKGIAERRVYWMLCVTTVLLFGCATLPFRIMILFNVFAETKFLNLWFFLFSRMAMYAGSALKPCIYLMFSERFRRGFKNVVLCRNRDEDRLNIEMEAAMLG